MPIILFVAGGWLGLDICARFFTQNALFGFIAFLVGGYLGFELGLTISRTLAGKDLYGRDNYKD
jgi:hypothetical protein